MEQEGVVSVWAGFFEDEEALLAYAAEEGYEEGDNDEYDPVISPFNRDFFGGEDLWPFDPDFWERDMVPVTTDAEALVKPFSEGTAIGPELKKLFPKGLERPCNAAILIYNYQYDEEEGKPSPDAPVTFLGAVPCDLG